MNQIFNVGITQRLEAVGNKLFIADELDKRFLFYKVVKPSIKLLIIKDNKKLLINKDLELIETQIYDNQ